MLNKFIANSVLSQSFSPVWAKTLSKTDFLGGKINDVVIKDLLDSNKVDFNACNSYGEYLDASSQDFFSNGKALKFISMARVHIESKLQETKPYPWQANKYKSWIVLRAKANLILDIMDILHSGKPSHIQDIFRKNIKWAICADDFQGYKKNANVGLSLLDELPDKISCDSEGNVKLSDQFIDHYLRWNFVFCTHLEEHFSKDKEEVQSLFIMKLLPENVLQCRDETWLKNRANALTVHLLNFVNNTTNPNLKLDGPPFQHDKVDKALTSPLYDEMKGNQKTKMSPFLRLELMTMCLKEGLKPVSKKGEKGEKGVQD